jgi:DNA-binding MarR family transcriptional regulator
VRSELLLESKKHNVSTLLSQIPSILKQLCSLTDGNLSRHLRVLETDKMIEIVKGHDRNRPQTICRITPEGRKRYLDYLSTLEQVVKDAVKGTKDERAPGLRALTPSRA